MRFLTLAAVVATFVVTGCKKPQQQVPVRQANTTSKKEAPKKSASNVSPEMEARIRAAREAKLSGTSTKTKAGKTDEERKAEIAAAFEADAVRAAEQRKIAAAMRAKKLAKVKASGANHHDAGITLLGNLVDNRGNPVDISRITTKKYLLVYYSAHWCGPCRMFTPQLVKWYNKNHQDYEVVFVSADKNGSAMLSYMKSAGMPWLAAKFGSSAHQNMGQYRSGSGIPHLVLLGPDGRRLASGQKNAYDKLRSLLGI